MKKYLSIGIPLILVLAANIYFRAYPAYFPQLKKQAYNMIYANIRQQAGDEVRRQFPQYDPLAQERLAKSRFEEYRRHTKQEAALKAKELFKRLRERFQDDSGQTYLMELDCWHWARYVRNVVYKGHPGDQVRQGRQFDSLMLSPSGDYLPWPHFIFYLAAFLYKIFSLVRDIPLFTFLFYLPLLFAAGYITLLFFFVRRLSGALGALIACLFIGLAPGFLPRSCAGWFDMDIMNVLFPVAILWTYLIASSAVSRRGEVIRYAVCAFLTGLFSFTWTDWWFIFLIIILAGITGLGYNLARGGGPVWPPKNDIRRQIRSLGLFAGMSLVWVIIFTRFEAISALYNQIRGALFLNKPLLPSIWPNVYSTVGELRKANFQEIASSLGGMPMTVISLVCFALLCAQTAVNRHKSAFHKKAGVLLIIWFFCMAYASYRGVRFIVFLAVPLGIAAGWIAQQLYEYTRSRAGRWPAYGYAGAALVLAGWLSLPQAGRTASNMYPLMNDPWYKLLAVLRTDTPGGATINSWWDFGDWFKVVAGRKVIFDGQSQNRPQAFWMAKAILSNDENEAMCILRMLNNGGNRAYEIVNECLNDPLKSMLLLESVIPLDSGEARRRLREYLPVSAADQVMLLLFDTPADAVFLVDYSMIYKISAISYLGNWNFAKVYMVQNFNRTEKGQLLDYLVKLGRNKDEMEKFYQEVFLIPPKDIENWLSHPVQFYGNPAKGGRKDDTVFFENGFIYDIKTRSCYNSNGQIPRSIFIKDGADVTEIAYNNANVPVSVLIVTDEERNHYAAVPLDRSLGRSLFVKLYFLNGFGLRHFKPLAAAADGPNIIASYKIEW